VAASVEEDGRSVQARQPGGFIHDAAHPQGHRQQHYRSEMTVRRLFVTSFCESYRLFRLDTILMDRVTQLSVQSGQRGRYGERLIEMGLEAGSTRPNTSNQTPGSNREVDPAPVAVRSCRQTAAFVAKADAGMPTRQSVPCVQWESCASAPLLRVNVPRLIGGRDEQRRRLHAPGFGLQGMNKRR
jgi:hypothetical protein